MEAEDEITITKVEGLQNPVQGLSKTAGGLPKTKRAGPGRPPKRRRTVPSSSAGKPIRKGRPKKGQEKLLPPRASGERKSNRVPVIKQEENFYTEKWTHENKRKLLEALKRLSPTDYEALSDYVVDKSPFQIEYYLQRLRKSIPWKGTQRLHVPLESWIYVASELVKSENKDYTDCFSRVMSVISNFEEFPTPCETVPDYRAIYRYLDCVLQGKGLPELGQIESAVILDLLHSLVEVLRTHETSQQRHVMKLKYEMLNSRMDVSNMMEYINKARRALTNDFTLSEYQGHSSNHQSQMNTSRDNQSNSSTIVTSKPNKSPLKSSQSNEPQPGCSSQSDDQGHCTGQSTSGSSKPNKSRFKSRQLNEPQPSCSSQSDQGHCTGQSKPVLNLNKRKRSSAKQRVENDSEMEDMEVDEENIKEKTAKTTKAEEDPNIPHKPSLFTLNPFCIPVSLLKLKRNPKIKLLPSHKPVKIEEIVPIKRATPQYRCPQPKTTGKIRLCMSVKNRRRKLLSQAASSSGSDPNNNDGQ